MSSQAGAYAAGQVPDAFDRTLPLARSIRALVDGEGVRPGETAFLEHLGRALAAARREGGFLAVLLIDIDGFGELNEHYGREAGDAFLAELNRRLLGVLRTSDEVLHLGADEFAVLVRYLRTAGDAEPIARKLLTTLRQPFSVADETIAITASIGIAIFPDHGVSGRDLLRAAELGMREAMRWGGDGMQISSNALGGSGREAALAEELRRGLARGEVELRFQPIHDLATGRVDSVEALARWRHPKLGLVGPDFFVHVAEETGLSGALTEVVLEGACAALARWRASGLAHLRMSVNLSASDFARPDLVESVCAALERHHLPPESLALELTEHALMEDIAGAARADALSRRGVGIAIDDFGTKYSSLGYLHRLPASAIKIDRSFVRDMGASVSASSIVSALVRIAQDMGLSLVAEGVEEVEQVRLLRVLGCHVMQGFLFSEPLSINRVEEYLARGAGTRIAGV